MEIILKMKASVADFLYFCGLIQNQLKIKHNNGNSEQV